jgi:hypothetical protein
MKLIFLILLVLFNFSIMNNFGDLYFQTSCSVGLNDTINEAVSILHRFFINLTLVFGIQKHIIDFYKLVL